MYKLKLTKQVAENCQNYNLMDSIVIGTSALAQYEINGTVGMYSGVFNNPFLIFFLGGEVNTNKGCGSIH